MLVSRRFVLFVGACLILALACNYGAEPTSISVTPRPQVQPTAMLDAGEGDAAPAELDSSADKWSLWVDGPHLRGANIYQRRTYPELDGPEFVGAGPVGPPYYQEDFDRLAALGANYVNVSHPGLFTEEPPYSVDLTIQHHLDQLLEMIGRADMFAVISFRTGPGRSEFTFMLDEAGDWYDESYLNHDVWQNPDTQQAWVDMWRAATERYRNHPIVVGYDLMVEPNADEAVFDFWEPDEFYPDHANSLADWNQFYPRIVTGIRQVDSVTPILVGAMGYSGVSWLPYLLATDDSRIVYTVHQYAPFQYTHQEPGFLGRMDYAYPGEMDLDWDGEDDVFSQDWLDRLLRPADQYALNHNAPIAVNEFGLGRWQPGAADFMRDEMSLFEQRGWNHALWVWDPSWQHWVEEVNAFNFRLGPDPDNFVEQPNELMDVIVSFWEQNHIRPSDFGE